MTVCAAVVLGTYNGFGIRSATSDCYFPSSNESKRMCSISFIKIKFLNETSSAQICEPAVLAETGILQNNYQDFPN